MKNQNKILYSLLILIMQFGYSQNTYISLKKITHNGVTDTVDNAPIVIDNANKVTVSGNKKITGTQYDASTAQMLSNGIMTWTTSYNLSTQKAWVTSNVTDASGNVYVTGGVATGTTNGVDLFVIKYDNTGSVLWSNTYNGPNSTSDVGTGITLDNSGNAYVCGASDGTLTSLVDYVTLKFDVSSGSQIWESRYNYSNSLDVPSGIIFNSSAQCAVVTGFSGQTYNNWDYFTISYDIYSGNVKDSLRQANPGTAQDKVFGMATDTLGNVYITGTAWNNISGNYDVQTTKMDTSLTVMWTQYYDGNNLNDGGVNISLDDSLNVYLTGYSFYQDSTLSNLLVMKYDNSGNLKWTKKKRPISTGSSAEGVRIKVKNDNEIFVGGNQISSGNQDMVLMRYDKFGNQNLEKSYNGPQNNTDKLLDFTLRTDSNFIYVSGRTYAGANLDSNITLTYRYDDFPRNAILLNDVPQRSENELIVRFQPTAMTNSVVNNLQVTHGVLEDFLTPSAISDLNTYFSNPVNNWPCYKVFPRITMNDSISVSRSGNTVKLESWWTTLGVYAPSGSNDTITYNTLNSAYTSVISADFCYFGLNTSNANDPLYSNGKSAGLVTNTTIPNANINIEPAWDISVGNASVTVGVYDTGINFTHQDFGDGTFFGSKILDGKNYGTGGGGIPLDQVNSNDFSGHGTSIAGIIGAIRNNNFAIAGVAGGNALANNMGVSLHDMRTASVNTVTCYSGHYLPDLLNGLLEGGIANVYNQDVMNHSFTFGNHPMYTLFDMYKDLFQLEIVLSVGSGNSDMELSPSCSYSSSPASFPDRWLLRVGSNDSTGFKASYSECGHNIDFLAPGDKSLFEPLTAVGNSTSDQYSVAVGCPTLWLSGTSQAAPHASGVAALMLSYKKETPSMPNPLAPEDIEEIMQLSAKDVTSGVDPAYTYSYDPPSGFGIIDAGKTLQNIKYPDYQVKHYSAIASTSNAVLDGSNQVTCIIKNWQPFWGSTLTIPQGTCLVDRYKVSTVVSHSLPSGYSFIKGWERDSESSFMGLESANTVNYCFDFFQTATKKLPNAPDIGATVTANSATLTGYIYKIIHPNMPGGYYWYPLDLNNNGYFNYSIYMQQITGIDEKTLYNEAVRIFPNPSNNKVYFKASELDLENMKVEVIDILGRTVLSEIHLKNTVDNSIEVSQLKTGVYFFNMSIGSNKVVKKVLVNH